MQIEKLENIYLSLFRIFLLIVATTAIVFASFNLVTSLYKVLDEADTTTVSPPDWSELKYKILPITQVVKSKRETSSSQPTDRVAPKNSNESKLRLVLKNLQKLFSEKDKLAFSEVITLEFLIEMKINVPRHEIDNFIKGMIVLSEDLILEKRIQQIESPERRIKIILESIKIYKDLFIARLESVNWINQEAIREAELRNAEGLAQLLYTFYALGGFVLLLLCMLVLKVEFNLRKIAPAITQQYKHEN